MPKRMGITSRNAGSSSLEGLNAGIRNSPTPGTPYPATALGTINDATPKSIENFSQGNYVNSYVTTDNNSGAQVIVNVTLPGHSLYPGVVVRYVSGNAGSYVINNVGVGAGAKQSDYAPQILKDSINNVWIQQSKDIINQVR